MTEQEWEQCNDPLAMIRFAGDWPTPRQHRLIAAACCRAVQHFIQENVILDAISAAEDLSDGFIDSGTLWQACAEAEAATQGLGSSNRSRYYASNAAVMASADQLHLATVIRFAMHAVEPELSQLEAPSVHQSLIQGQLAHYIREIIGNPFSPPVEIPVTPPITSLASQIYHLQVDAMGELADALEQSGCSPSVVSHCRAGVPDFNSGIQHPRGFWVLDQILQKERRDFIEDLDWEKPLAEPHLYALFRNFSSRKFRLWGLACWKQWSQLSEDDPRWEAWDLLRAFTDTLGCDEKRDRALRILSEDQGHRGKDEPDRDHGMHITLGDSGVAAFAETDAFHVPRSFFLMIHDPEWRKELGDAFTEEDLAYFLHYQRDIFGPPFFPDSLPAQWLTSTVQAMAQTIYRDDRFEDLPILGDALEDAGCDREDLLSHCREGEHHARGCWALDLILGLHR